MGGYCNNLVEKYWWFEVEWWWWNWWEIVRFVKLEIVVFVKLELVVLDVECDREKLGFWFRVISKMELLFYGVINF